MPHAAAASILLFIGTYTSNGSKGIYTVDLDTNTGQLSAPAVVAEAENPSFLAFHPTRPVLYVVNETSAPNGEGGSVTAFAIGAGGALTKVNAQSTKGNGPCYLTVDRRGAQVLVANYGNGRLAALPIDADGRVQPASLVIQDEGRGPNAQRQQGPHAHSINIDATGRYAIAADLGIDKLLVYRFDPRAATPLTANDPPSVSTAPGDGPRHLAFHPNGRVAYVINELASTITPYAWDAQHGTLKALSAVRTLPADFTGENTTAEVVVHPSGRFVYGSNRGHDSIAIFAVDEKDGRLTPAGHRATEGKTPRNFIVDPTGAFLIAANQESDSLIVFRIDPQTGALTPTGGRATVPSPVCVRVAPSSALAPAR